MDNVTSHDSFGVEDVQSIIGTGQKIVKSIKDRKLTKQANEFVRLGKYWNLSPYSKSLIPIPQSIINETSGKGITQQAILNLPAQGQKAPYPGTTPAIIAALQLASGLNAVPNAPVTGEAISQAADTSINTKSAATADKVKKILPYVIGAVVIGLVIYFIAKK